MRYFARINYRIGNQPVQVKRFLCFDFRELSDEIHNIVRLGGTIYAVKFERTV